ncbi:MULTISPECIES: Hsp20/alpha crystallin family protein [Mangrovimonas]|uniref:Hsp20/alpha crystallin family protein n=2 Tax=Flavobacteriaceae TaxID=49546 RepID=UPI000AFFB25A|nr:MULTISPECIES: Hsp20/alpha crystallin family protein [Mangrovimonas]MCF1195350.1 Hsp20/alpha crystallin family protein [Mangrovimonas futianensis]MCF1422042.1 Hsp20/alpha crystallin family protein [Mangrovimonas futianensis]
MYNTNKIIMSNLIPTKRNGLRTSQREQGTLPSLSSWIDDIFNRDFGSDFLANFNTGMTLPSVNIKENKDAYVVEMAVPGFNKSDFEVNVDNELLTISAETKTEKNEEEENYTRREFGYSSFKRSFTLPDSADAEKINAEYVDGLLKVQIAKREEAKRKPAKKIEIS